jgi:hypothetical protein
MVRLPGEAAGSKLKAFSLEPTAEGSALLESRHAIRYDGGAKEE